MAIGSGKHDDVLMKALELAGAKEGMLVIFDGNKGPGFSVAGTAITLFNLPKTLMDIAAQVEKDQIELALQMINKINKIKDKLNNA